MSDGDLEGKCEETGDLQISTSGIPIIKDPEHCLIDEQKFPSTERLLVDSSTPTDEVYLENTVNAPLGEGRFWLWFHLNILSYSIRELSEKKEFAELRAVLLENNVKREYEEKTKLEEALKAEKHDKIGIFTRYIHRIYLHRLEESDREYAEESLVKANEKIKALESKEFMQLFVELGLSNRIEEKEQTIREYAKRFGTPESLWKLKAAEENRAMNGQNLPKYQSIEELLTYYGTGKLPKTTGQRVIDFLEKIANPDTYYDIASAVYDAFRTKSKVPKIKDCG